MKKALSLLLIAGLLSAQAVYAKDIEISSNNKKITVTAQLEPSSYGFMIAAKQGEDINNNNNVFAVLEQQSDENGNVIFSFDMPQERNGQATDGIYDVFVKQNGKNVLSDSFAYATEQSKSNLISQLKNAQDAATVKEIMLNADNLIALKALKIGAEAYSALNEANQTVAAEGFVTAKSASMSDSEICDAINHITALWGINSDSGNVQLYIAAANFTDGETYYESISDLTLISEINEYILANRTYADTTALELAYKQVNALYKINNAKFDQMDTLLAKYSTVLNLDNDSNYASYKNAANKSEINKALLNLIKKSMPKTTAQLSSYIMQAVKSAGSSSGGNSGGGSSGGGSGSKSDSKTNTAITIPTAPAEEVKPVFDDIADYAWATKAVTALAKANVISGDGTGNFDGNKEMTREEFVTMLVKAAGVYDPVAVCYHFNDVSEDDWYYHAVGSAFSRKLVSGVEENLFGVGRKLIRQDMMVLAYRAAADKLPAYSKDRKLFADDGDISNYAKEAVYELYMRGVVSGMGENQIMPKANVTKAQGAQIIYGLFYNN